MCYKGYKHTEESKNLNREKHLGISLRKGRTFIFFDGVNKSCSSCKLIKSVDMFQRDIQKPSGLSSQCKECRRNSKIKKLYNLSIDEYKVIYSSQSGRCKICRIEQDILHVDHCHVSGDVRGLLCSKCNMAIGLFKDDVSLMGEAIKYISNKV